MNKFSINVIIGLFFLALIHECIKCEIPVTAICGRPGVPPKATKWLITPERSRFEDKEKVNVVCKKGEFPLIKNEVVCNKGRWSGKQTRCGQHMEVRVIQFDIFDCQSVNNRLIVSQPLNRSAEKLPEKHWLRHNSFHRLRFATDLRTSANGSECYSYKIRFERKVQIWFLLVDIWVNKNDSKIGPELKPDLGRYRDCNLVKNTAHIMGSDTVFGYYFICDLKSDADFQGEKSEMLDTITVNIKTNFTEEVGLEAVFVGDIFTETTGSEIAPDCGQMTITNIGVDAQEEVGHTSISCNDSFVDMSGQNITNIFSLSGNPKHKLMCNWNGQWVGQWPTCLPKNSCPKEEIFNEMDNSVAIEEIGNVYYLNESKWFAINDSFIRYSCLLESHIMIGKNIRTCLKTGQWSNKAPFCTRTVISVSSITLILFVVLIIFVLIVLLVFRIHSKGVNRKLRKTRDEINVTQSKRYSEQFYADFKSENLYESETARKTLDYESVEYDSVFEQQRYQIRTQVERPPSPEYLVMLTKS